jgi:hypothetical protein
VRQPESLLEVNDTTGSGWILKMTVAVESVHPDCCICAQ